MCDTILFHFLQDNFRTELSFLGLCHQASPSVHAVYVLLQGSLHALAEVFCSKAQEAQGGNGYEIGSELNKLGDASRISRRIATCSDPSTPSPDFGNDLAHDLPHCRSAGIAHALAQVTRGDMQYVDTRHSQNRVKIVH